jgi:uncharacterized protein YcaQ
MEVFDRLRSIQFDPIAPVGCNHDLVLQARLADYKVGDWEKLAYTDRLIYDGWDKQASLVPFDGWPLRRLIHKLHRRSFEKKIFEDHADAVEAILGEITRRGPMMPRDFEFQLRREEWKDSWHGPSVTKQTLRALWHSGLVMTAGRKNGQHLYDLTERIVPKRLLNEPLLPDEVARIELALERHRAMGFVRPVSPPEIWSYQVMNSEKRQCVAELLGAQKVLPIEVEGVKANATPEFLALLDKPSIESRVVFIAPLDPLLWDRKMTAHVFGFDYIWEIYTPLAKRKWGYYVLPVLFGDELVARVEFWCREGVLEVREWHFEARELGSGFWSALEEAVRRFMRYCSASEIRVRQHIEPKVKELFAGCTA